ncbi:hypothetical protein PF005_g14956 [Phytophthora fragariae]|uniref:Uncharacterized protein n=1 Tax=Phytophthora fragariae TaxID=53985 RepID=A0A6A3XQ67_9STRA|nr:hypothetical protein PF003_g14053 [Phytophthora fragariae]KAE8934148.1 hypothetical protein PF009_g15868 [Phytophthora fragariae]KAE9102114.1 hypothetical protein PF007_g14872 [Phytophthora fragariae]KAE9201432.1 hypothetical protein PF005_g14956 [Phytophthora fragariae]KAE9219703.1 hypothetical protein PF002_g16109 [Phytophthora fragariae]
MQVLEGRDARDAGIKDAESKRSGRAGPVKAQGGPHSSKRGDDGSKAAESRKMNKQSDWKVAKGRKSRGPRGQLDGQGLHGGRDEGTDNGDGTEVFAQLKRYLATDASQEYIFHTVTRLNDLAKERRFVAYKNSKKTKEGQELGERELRAEWSDPATEDEKQKYEGVVSYWDQQNSKHVSRLKETMNQWVMKLHLEEEEIEARLRFFTFEEVLSTHKTADTPSGQVEGSYLRAVETGLRPMKPERERAAEQQRMYDLSVAPANEVTKLRKRTTEEDQALLMILTHDIEVPYPPNFLAQRCQAAVTLTVLR